MCRFPFMSSVQTQLECFSGGILAADLRVQTIMCCILFSFDIRFRSMSCCGSDLWVPPGDLLVQVKV